MVHPILSHSVLLVIGLIAMGMIVSSLSSTFSKTERNLVTVEADYIAESAKGKILEIYSLVGQSNYSNGTFQLNLPERIGDEKYVILLEQNLLTLRVPFENDVIEVVKSINMTAEISGESSMPASVVVEKDGIVTMELV